MKNEHTDKKYEEELKRLREEILYMGGLVEDQIQKTSSRWLTVILSSPKLSSSETTRLIG